MTWVNYIGTPFQRYWERCGENHIHPDDQPFFDANNVLIAEDGASESRPRARFETEKFRPCPFDGPMETAKVVFCLANPNYPKIGDDYSDVILRQRSGIAPLPSEWDSTYYKKFAKSLQKDVNQMRNLVCLFNVCPYPSANLEGVEKRFAAGLPSVWAAQQHLREVLIPEAGKGQIFLVVIRKHELWGVTEGFKSPNIAISRGLERSGTISEKIAAEIRNWLGKAG